MNLMDNGTDDVEYKKPSIYTCQKCPQYVFGNLQI